MHFDRHRLSAELLGTFFLVLIGPGAAMVNAAHRNALGPIGVSLAFGFVVLAMVTAARAYEYVRNTRSVETVTGVEGEIA